MNKNTHKQTLAATATATEFWFLTLNLTDLIMTDNMPWILIREADDFVIWNLIEWIVYLEF